MHQRERRITSLIDSHIKLSALYPHCGTRKFPKSSEIKIASPEVWDPTKKTVTPTTTIRSKIAHFPRRRGCRETISGETPMGPCAPLACSKAALITVRYVSYMPDWKKRSTRSKKGTKANMLFIFRLSQSATPNAAKHHPQSRIQHNGRI